MFRSFGGIIIFSLEAEVRVLRYIVSALSWTSTAAPHISCQPCTCPSFCFQPHAFGLFAVGDWFFECGGAPNTGHQVHTRLKNDNIDGRTSRLKLIELYKFSQILFPCKINQDAEGRTRYAQIPDRAESRGPSGTVSPPSAVPCCAVPCRSVSKCSKYQSILIMSLPRKKK